MPSWSLDWPHPLTWVRSPEHFTCLGLGVYSALAVGSPGVLSTTFHCTLYQCAARFVCPLTIPFMLSRTAPPFSASGTPASELHGILLQAVRFFAHHLCCSALVMDLQWPQAALLPLLLLFLGILVGGTPAWAEASPAAVETTDDNAATHLFRGSHTLQPRNLTESSASTRLQLRGHGQGQGCHLTGNPIDDCWRCDANWAANRKRLADCGIGFGRNALGGKNGGYYVVTDSSDDDAVTPKPGTLRHAVIQSEPLWIVFERDMVIQLKEELIMNSFKTIDGRGADVHIANGACFTLQFISNVIIHGVKVYNCRSAGNSMVRSSPTHFGWRTRSDGDGISIFGSRDIWVDHVYLSNCEDGLIDAVMSSTAITISNNYFTNHDKVMLLGHSDEYSADKGMQVTVALNHFGDGLVQRMPRCRFGQFHIVNNDYTRWEMYAVGGSANPTIYSEGNRYLASDVSTTKEVTKRDTNENWQSWNWWSLDDLMLNGAYFVQSGAKTAGEQRYTFSKSVGTPAKSAALVGIMTVQAGPLFCRARAPC